MSRAAGPVLKCDLFKNADGSSRVSSKLLRRYNNAKMIFFSIQGMGYVVHTKTMKSFLLSRCAYFILLWFFLALENCFSFVVESELLT